MIRCPQCGYENALGHIFCIQCRSKLDLRAIEGKVLNEPESRPGRSRRLVWLALFAAIAACAASALWPMPLTGRKGTAADAQQARRKIILLEKRLSPAPQLFLEREINAYLDVLLRKAQFSERRSVWPTTLQAVEVVIHPNAIMVAAVSVWGPVTVGYLQFGPWRVTGRITAAPVRRPPGFRWTIRSGRIGHLPLPGPLSAPVIVILRPFLGASFRERALLANATHLELEEGRMAVAVKTGTGKPMSED